MYQTVEVYNMEKELHFGMNNSFIWKIFLQLIIQDELFCNSRFPESYLTTQYFSRLRFLNSPICLHDN